MREGSLALVAPRSEAPNFKEVVQRKPIEDRVVRIKKIWRSVCTIVLKPGVVFEGHSRPIKGDAKGRHIMELSEMHLEEISKGSASG